MGKVNIRDKSTCQGKRRGKANQGVCEVCFHHKDGNAYELFRDLQNTLYGKSYTSAFTAIVSKLKKE